MIKHFLLYSYRFTGELVPIVPFLALFYQDAGLSVSELTFVFLTLAATVFLLEIPTGKWTDRSDVRAVLIVSRVFKLLAFSTVFILDSYAGFVVGSIFWGISSALDSGAFQSYVFMYARRYGVLKQFESLYSRVATCTMLAFFLSVLLTTQVDYFGFDGLQIIGLVSLSLSIVLCIFLPRVHKELSESQSQVDARTAGEIMKYLAQNPVLALVMCIGILAGGFKGTLDEYTSIGFSEFGASLLIIGYLLFFLEILRSAGTFISQWIHVSIRRQTQILMLCGVLFVAIGYYENYLFMLAAVTAVILVDAILWIHNDTALQRMATDQNRATLSSYKNFATELLAMIIFLSIWLTDEVTVSSLYLVLGAILAVSSVVLLFLHRAISSE